MSAEPNFYGLSLRFKFFKLFGGAVHLGSVFADLMDRRSIMARLGALGKHGSSMQKLVVSRWSHCRLTSAAGLVGDIAGQEDESLEVAVQRELQEETGYVAGRLQRLCKGPAAPGMCAERLTLFLATDLKKVGEGGGDETESITVHEVAMQEIITWMAAKEQEGVEIDLKVYAGLFFLQRNRG